MNVLGLGNALVDILVQFTDDSILGKLGYPKGSMQLISASEIPTITSYTKKFSSVMVSGGSAANTIHGISCLGTYSGYIGKVGTDDLGSFYANDLKSAKVDVKLLYSDSVTGRAYTLITPDAERTFATYLGAAVEMQASELPESYFDHFSLLHIEGYLLQNKDLIERALQIAKLKNMHISLDLASFNVVESNLDLLKELIPKYVDILFANEEEARAFTGKGPEDSLLEFGSLTKIAVVKTGRDGSLIYSNNKLEKIDIIPVTAVDTTGAGDQYAAGFLHGFSEKMPLKKCGKIGALLAGKVIESYGARIPMDKWMGILEEVKKIKES
jgi:sugar/nucleoside kinase (ribokinase family)